jgi:cell division protein FtsN
LAPTPVRPTPKVDASAAATVTTAPSGSNAAAGGPYFLQAGSFRVLEDAEALRAKILLMGMPVEIQRAEVNGLQVNRVRVGPFARIDDMNQTRTRLGQEKIPTAVVRQ